MDESMMSITTNTNTHPVTVTVKLLNGDLLSITQKSQYTKRDIEFMVAHQYKRDFESVQLTLLEDNDYLEVFKDPRITVSVEVLKYEYAHLDVDEPVYHIEFYQYNRLIESYKIIIKEQENGLSFALAESFHDDYYYNQNDKEICYYTETDETQWFSSPSDCIAFDLYSHLNQDNIRLLADEIMDKLLTARLQNHL